MRNNIALVLSFVLTACGTHIETGRNKNPQTSDKNSGAGVSLDGGEKPTPEVQNNVGSCFASNEVTAEIFQEFCNLKVSKHLYATFERILDPICKEKKFGNLIFPSCAWERSTGTDAKQILDAKKKIHQISYETTSTTLSFLGTLATTLEASDQSFEEYYPLTYSNPSEYSKRGYKMPVDTEITALANRRDEVHEVDVFEYQIRFIRNNVQLGFDADVYAGKTKNGLQFYFNAAKDPKVRVMTGNNLTFAYKLKEGKTAVIVFEEVEVDDKGAHSVVKPILQGFMAERILAFHKNMEVSK